ATLGAVTATEGYFAGIRAVCDRYGILLILDEVMCGMGRTGSLFAYGQEGIQPDMVTVAKGLGGGYQPIAALITSAAVHDTIAQGSGFFQHGHTYLGHPVACATAVAVLDVMAREKIVEGVTEKGARLRAALTDSLSDAPWVGDIRGRGLFIGIELVQDRESKKPFAPELKLHAKVKQRALDHGLMCYPMGGTLDGQRGDHILLAPPLVMPDHELDEVVRRLTMVLTEITRELPR
ncbi:MAG: aminotransferase class III-fold pyridoxal phosphate-dependent enzyme, partial [Burkholderiaceae bacterium]